ncbi:MAG: hypothetical protein OXF58_02450 [Gammaproteobacteria bacterium]|nr:hypothetical protein [Gammaproteobacteria bacterium]
MQQETLAAAPRGDFDHIYELAKLSGEVRVLKWGAAISITVIFAYLTIVSQQISDLRASLELQVSEVREQASALGEGQTIIRERLGVIEQRVTANGQRIDSHEHL